MKMDKSTLKKLFLNHRRRRDEPEPSDSELNVNHAKYTVAVKTHGVYLLMKLAMVLAYLLWFAVWLIISIKTIPTLMVIAIVLLPAIPFSWRLVQVEASVVVSGGEFIGAKIYGNMVVKEKFVAKISEVLIIAPYKTEYISKFLEEDKYKVVNIMGNPKSTDKYFMLVGDTAVYFEAAQKLLKALKYYNSSATVLSSTCK